MTKILVVKAHPLTGAESKSVAVADEFLKQYRKQNPDDTIEVLDLFASYIPEIDKDLLSAMYALGGGSSFDSLSVEQQKAMGRYDELMTQFLAADKVIVINALWNLGVPGRLKSWIDSITVAGKTFKYTENGPVGLLDNKKVLHIQSGGGHYDGSDFAAQYVKAMFNFVGITDHQRLSIEGIDYAPDKKEEIMASAFEQAGILATTF
ncbi:FMN-dependent NADH-azoreductase [Vagococcus elongatus]|uniref:FMN dependent NADH:quinone oxidoreductase n=1 Tax=Vagococcus elongatus TaxID=180344 RepID=A0A430ALX9_9ENTE|nr:FMN-dependent NADH-azoreductase [Vagococcus elongatus]RSU08897.1 FMN-dependent NADH-azoreductase [Vagococcus elongatus]